jgi:hypothetical protein
LRSGCFHHMQEDINVHTFKYDSHRHRWSTGLSGCP